jgi:hypothetical protein
MAEMADVPTLEQLYETVDDLYHEENPSAPHTIDPSLPDHEQWRDVWLAIRDRVLNNETNRVYWDTYPDAPVTIDPHNPEHAEYVKGWNDIRARIYGNQLMPPSERSDRQTDLDAGLSFIRSEIFEAFAEMLKSCPDAMKDEVGAWAESLVTEVMKAMHDRQITPGEEWTGHTVKVEDNETPPMTMTFTAFATSTDGEVHAGVHWDLDDPKIEMEYDDTPQGDDIP